jgi:hypothetical protein
MGALISQLLKWLGFERLLDKGFDKLGIPETMEFKKTILTKTVTREIKLPLASPVQKVQESLKEGKPMLFTSTEVKDLRDLPPEIANDPEIRAYVKMASGKWSPLDSKVFSWVLFVALGVFLAFALFAFVSLVRQLPGSR